MTKTRWSDETFLEGLRRQGDPEADAAVLRLREEHGIEAVNKIFKTMSSEAAITEDPDAPQPLVDFAEQTGDLPADLDLEKIARGQEVFLRHAPAAAMVMLGSSLPRGYAAPTLNEILTISGDLERHPYLRLLGVIQLLVNLAKPGAFAEGGLAVATGQKLRLLHAGVRSLSGKYRPKFPERFGVPVNHEDMLATLMAFSYLVIDGLDRLDSGLTDTEREEYYYVWRTFGLLMGLYPEGKPQDSSLVPANYAEAAEFFNAYAKRQFTMPDENPAGPVLAGENLAMMKALIPTWLRMIGFNMAPRMIMTELMTKEELAMVGIKPLMGHKLLHGVLHVLLKALHVLGDSQLTGSFVENISLKVFQGMINLGRGSEVTFQIPNSLKALRGSGFV